jgi:phage terminase large subunit
MGRVVQTRKMLQQPEGPQSFTLPYNFRPRSYQREVFVAYEKGVRRFVLCWHRRSGKDRTCLALTTVAMADRPGLFLHIYPTMELARKAMWIAQDSAKGQPFLDSFPPAWIVGEPNKTEMLIRVKALPGQAGGSVWKLAGADDPDSLRGLNPIGVVLSEYSEHDKRVWEEVVSPILNENNGWVIFNFTPKGKNHAHKIYETARAHPDRWFCSLKTVEDTTRDAPGESGAPVVSLDKIQQERDEGIAEEIIQQESYCSFDGYLLGTIHGDWIRVMRKDGRICRVPREVSFPVGVALDIGRTDGTAIIFYQTLARELRIIDYLAFRANKIGDSSAAHYAIKRIQEKPYLVTRAILPNDAQIKGYSAAQSTVDIFREHIPDTVLLEKMPVQQGLDMVRAMASKMVIDEVACGREQEDKMPSFLDSVGNYRRLWNEVKGDFSGEPVHDQFSHGSDALRYGAMEGFTPLDLPGQNLGPAYTESNYQPFMQRRPTMQPVGSRW